MEEEAYFIYIYYAQEVIEDPISGRRKIKNDIAINKITRQRKDMGTECKRIQVDFDPSKSDKGFLVYAKVWLDKNKTSSAFGFPGFFDTAEKAEECKKSVAAGETGVLDKKEIIDEVQISCMNISRY
jgi:hypothetical protein